MCFLAFDYAELLQPLWMDKQLERICCQREQNFHSILFCNTRPIRTALDIRVSSYLARQCRGCQSLVVMNALFWDKGQEIAALGQLHNLKICSYVEYIF